MPIRQIKIPAQQVSTHSRLKAAGAEFWEKGGNRPVSTHSRLKAAGSAQVWGKPNLLLFQHTAA